MNKKSFLIKVIRIAPMILVMGAIFLLSCQTGDSLNVFDFYIPGIDKVAHFGIYGVLAYTVLLAISPDFRHEFPMKSIVLTIIFCLLYGISDELHQSFVPGRFPSSGDLLADVAGATTLCCGFLSRNLRRLFPFL